MTNDRVRDIIFDWNLTAFPAMVFSNFVLFVVHKDIKKDTLIPFILLTIAFVCCEYDAVSAKDDLPNLPYALDPTIRPDEVQKELGIDDPDGIKIIENLHSLQMSIATSGGFTHRYLENLLSIRSSLESILDKTKN